MLGLARRPIVRLWACMLVAATACTVARADEAPTPSSLTQAAIYRGDDRRQPSEITLPRVAALARTTVALIPRSSLLVRENSEVLLSAPKLGATYQLCASEPFRDELSAAVCSGVLVADDLVLTAGHCFGEGHNCQDLSFVLDFTAANAEDGLLDSDTVFGCHSLLLKRSASLGVPDSLDFALVRLDRSTGREAPVMSIAPLHEGDVLSVFGFPKGIPMKVDASARVMDVPALGTQFRVAADTFGGNSGGPFFDERGHLRGLLLGGAIPDFEPTASGCQLSALAPEGAEGQFAQSFKGIWDEACGPQAVDVWCEETEPEREASPTGAATVHAASCSAYHVGRPSPDTTPLPVAWTAWLALYVARRRPRDPPDTVR